MDGLPGVRGKAFGVNGKIFQKRMVGCGQTAEVAGLLERYKIPVFCRHAVFDRGGDLFSAGMVVEIFFFAAADVFPVRFQRASADIEAAENHGDSAGFGNLREVEGGILGKTVSDGEDFDRLFHGSTSFQIFWQSLLMIVYHNFGAGVGQSDISFAECLQKEEKSDNMKLASHEANFIKRGIPMQTRLREMRTAAGWTQQQLAERVHVSARTIISIEKEQYNPSLMLAYRLAREFGVSVEELCCLEENRRMEENAYEND